MALNVRTAVGIALIWVATVAGVSATAWFAIDRAGQNLNGDGVNAAPGSVGTLIPTGPASGSTPATAGSLTSRDRSASVTGGQVSVRCTGAAILLRVAQPENGWRVDVDSSGPQEVDLSFRRGLEDTENGDGDALQKTEVKAVCSDGSPVFSVEDH